VRTARALHVLVIDKGRRAVAVRMHIPAAWPASVQRLTAPSARASTGVTLGGQQLGRDARWHGPRDIQTVEPRSRGYDFTVSGISAALLTVPATPTVSVIHPSS
jgi:glycosyl hydrolase family 79